MFLWNRSDGCPFWRGFQDSRLRWIGRRKHHVVHFFQDQAREKWAKHDGEPKHGRQTVERKRTPQMSCPRLGRKTIVGVPGEVLSKDVKDFGALDNLVASWVTLTLIRSIFSTNKHKQTWTNVKFHNIMSINLINLPSFSFELQGSNRTWKHIHGWQAQWNLQEKLVAMVTPPEAVGFFLLDYMVLDYILCLKHARSVYFWGLLGFAEFTFSESCRILPDFQLFLSQCCFFCCFSPDFQDIAWNVSGTSDWSTNRREPGWNPALEPSCCELYQIVFPNLFETPSHGGDSHGDAENWSRGVVGEQLKRRVAPFFIWKKRCESRRNHKVLNDTWKTSRCLWSLVLGSICCTVAYQLAKGASPSKESPKRSKLKSLGT